MLSAITPESLSVMARNAHVSAEVIELRVQTVKVSGQELLTKDKGQPAGKLGREHPYHRSGGGAYQGREVQ
jgi:hypothetical protein